MKWVVYVYAVMGVVTFLAYGWDKRCARGGRWRVAESTLHGLEFFGGWFGGLAGMVVFRHKWKKISYVGVFVGIGLLHAAGWVGWWWMMRGR